MEELQHKCDTDGSKMVHFQTENLKYLKSTNFLGFRTTENEIYVKFCLRKILVARDSIVDILGIKAGRFLRVFSKEAPGKLKNTNRSFSRYFTHKMMDHTLN